MVWLRVGWLVALSGLGGCSLLQPGPAQVVSVSDDGRYVVSSHDNRRLILWDTEERWRSVVSRNANIYSAHFVSGRDDTFLWQDLDDVVHVQTVDGEVLESFEHFPTYGHVMGSDLKTYFSSDARFHIYKGWGDQKEPVKTDSEGGQFLGTLLNLALHEDAGILLSVAEGADWDKRALGEYGPLDDRRISRFDGPVVWDLETTRPLNKLPGLYGKAHGDISPDGQYVVAAGENKWGFVWETDTGERRWQLANYWYGKPRRDVEVPEGKELGDLPPEERLRLDRLIDIPEGGREGEEGHLRGAQVGALFIDDEWFVRVERRSHFVALHHIDDPFHTAFLDLGQSPYPGTDRHIPSIDAAPASNVLVTGQRRPKGGINVYRFDPETRALDAVWTPRGWFAF
ncbi:hypothetical protein ACNSTU_08155 [Aquisalimonas sp. APHAB1-3]|uniref:hypothetical protein n=1 Tax=unclassified Aquisalimonas TaxID=2644645 RepID=UPI0025BC96D9|nr:hypothetical protein [Aquisalimonas sp.]